MEPFPITIDDRGSSGALSTNLLSKVTRDLLIGRRGMIEDADAVRPTQVNVERMIHLPEFTAWSIRLGNVAIIDVANGLPAAWHREIVRTTQEGIYLVCERKTGAWGEAAFINFYQEFAAALRRRLNVV